MKVGGNRQAREFFESQDDYDDSMSIQQKYNTVAAVLYRDKISTLAQGNEWDAKKALTKVGNAQKNTNTTNNSSSLSHSKSAGALSSYQNGGDLQDSNLGYQNINSESFRNQKDQFFNRKQSENAMKPE